MGDKPGSAASTPTAFPSTGGSSGIPTLNASAPLHAQLDHHARPSPHKILDQYDQRAFDMGAVAHALPSGDQPSTGQRQMLYDLQIPASMSMLTHGSAYSLHPQAPQYPSPRGSRFPDQAALVRSEQQQLYMAQSYGGQPSQMPSVHRQQPIPLHPMMQFPRMDMFPYGMSSSQQSPLDTRFHSLPNTMGLHDAMPDSHPARRAPETSTVPSFPRGPPRKPKQSGHALWVGNLPPSATVTDLKDHFSRDATHDIESLFLIAKSNCAFVNYRTEEACVAAMNRFHDSRFNGVRLVCRLRRGLVSTLATPVKDPEAASSQISETSRDLESASPLPEEPSSPLIVGGPSAPQVVAAGEDQSEAAGITKVPEKFFTVKSLTLQDLEASVKNGVWATQSHNEAALNQAYKEAEHVYLIFSANKSGEYFGYARMTSDIAAKPTRRGSAPSSSTAAPAPTDGPRSIPTPATEHAPRGRIIDDLARGTIFWEAESSDDEREHSPEKEGSGFGMGDGWGRPFQIEWLSTARLPFYRTRGLRNPWNANREVKIARDGTELEPSVGRRLLSMFHRPPQPPNISPIGMPPGGMLF